MRRNRAAAYGRSDFVPDVAKGKVEVGFVAALVAVAGGLADINNVDGCCFISHLGDKNGEIVGC